MRILLLAMLVLAVFAVDSLIAVSQPLFSLPPQLAKIKLFLPAKTLIIAHKTLELTMTPKPAVATATASANAKTNSKSGPATPLASASARKRPNAVNSNIGTAPDAHASANTKSFVSILPTSKTLRPARACVSQPSANTTKSKIPLLVSACQNAKKLYTAEKGKMSTLSSVSVNDCDPR